MNCQSNRKNQEKRDQFRVSIRKKQLEQIFKQQRFRFKVEQVHHQNFQMIEKLNSLQKRQEWVHSKSLQFSGYPNHNWKYLILSLVPAGNLFSGDFSLWIKSGIVQKLCQVFKYEYEQFQLASISARVLSNMLCIQIQSKQLQKEILEYNILIDIIEKVYNRAYVLEDCAYFLTLLANIAFDQSIIINMIIRQGGVACIRQFGKRIIQQNCKNRQMIKILYRSMRMIAVYITSSTTYTIINVLIQMVNDFFQYLGIKQGEQILNLLLQVTNFIVKINKNTVTKTLMEYHKAIITMLECLLASQSSVRHNSIIIFSTILCSSDTTISKQLIKMKFLQYLKNCYDASQNKTNFNLILVQILTCIGNIVSDKDPITIEMISKHQIMNIIINHAHFKQPKAINKQSIYVINTLLMYGGYQISRYLEETYKLTDILALNFGQIPKNMAQVKQIAELVYCIANHIKNYNKVMTYQKNKIIHILQSIYGYSKLIQNLQSQMSKTNILQIYVDQTIQLLSN